MTPGAKSIDELLALRIDKKSPIPVYVQISDRIRELIQELRLQPGSAFPPERVMCERVGVSKMTLRQAYGMLEREGVIEARRGSGTFVSQPQLEKNLRELRSFTEEMAARGKTASSRLLKFGVKAPDFRTQKFFGMGEGQQVYRIERLRLADQAPVAIETCELPESMFPGLARFDLAQRSLYRVMEEEYGVRLAWCREEISAAMPDAAQKKLLQLDRTTALLTIRRKSYAANDQAIELASTAYGGDKYSAVIDAARSR